MLTLGCTYINDNDIDSSSECIHTGAHYLRTEPSHTQSGNVEFWMCDKCNETFLTKPNNLKWEEKEVDFQISSNHPAFLAKLSCSHEGNHYLQNYPTYEENGNKEFWECEKCNEVFLEKPEGVFVTKTYQGEIVETHIAFLEKLVRPTDSFLRTLPQFDYPVPITLEIPNATYSIDATGKVDSSSRIQSALNYVQSLGGGTLFIQRGTYLLSGQITIPSRVTLVGVFDKDNREDLGTVFLCNYGKNSSKYNSQIKMTTNSGINGITFYYPNQNIENVFSYSYTIRADQMLALSISNLLFINSYNGIGINKGTEGSGELVNIENIYGTFLHNFFEGYCLSDVGYFTNINISPSYYLNSSSQFYCSNESLLKSYLTNNLEAFTLGDLDDYILSFVNIDYANIGINFTEQSVRESQAFWGMLHGFKITNTNLGVVVGELYSSGGVIITNSILGKVQNNSYFGKLKLAKCQFTEEYGYGSNIVEEGCETYEEAEVIDYSNNYSIPYNYYLIDDLDNTGSNDISDALSEKLSSINGGVVVLKNGLYRVDKSVIIPKNTMITSFANSFSRSTQDENKTALVKFISYSNQPIFILSDYSGINGIKFTNGLTDPISAMNNLSSSNGGESTAVKFSGNNCFILNSEAAYSYFGFDLSSSKNHYVKYCYGSTYDTFIKSNGGSGKIIFCLTNLNFISRHNLVSWLSPSSPNYANFQSCHGCEGKDLFISLRDNLYREYSKMFSLSNSEELLFGNFAYGNRHLVESINSKIKGVCLSQDYIKDAYSMLKVEGGEFYATNMFRVFGKSFILNGGRLVLVGRIDFANKREKFFDSSISLDDSPSVIDLSSLNKYTLNSCDSVGNSEGGQRNKTTKKEGSASMQLKSKVNPVFYFTFNTFDLRPYIKGYIHFWIYCSNVNYKGSNSQVELTSSGTCDQEELYHDVLDQITKSGWNEIIIPISDFGIGSETKCNYERVNYFRFFAIECNTTYYIDQIEILY